MPDGLLELMRVPGLSAEKIHRLHAELGVSSLADLERAAQDGSRTSSKAWARRRRPSSSGGIAFARDAGRSGAVSPRAHRGQRVARVRPLAPGCRDCAEIAGSLRRQREVVADVDIVAACARAPAEVAQSFARADRSAERRRGRRPALRFDSRTARSSICTACAPDAFAVALWRATGSNTHLDAVERPLAAHGIRVVDDTLVDSSGRPCLVPGRGRAVCRRRPRVRAAGAARRHGRGGRGRLRRAAAARRARRLRGVLHCHTHYSDGKATIAEMAAAARARGGATSASRTTRRPRSTRRACRASGCSSSTTRSTRSTRRHGGFRVLKGVEADILADGRLDYDAELLDRFDYVIASIHSRFKMDGAGNDRARAARDGRPAHDDPRAPDGQTAARARALRARPRGGAAESAAIAASRSSSTQIRTGWTSTGGSLRRATELGVTVEIGPDAHSPAALEWTDLGVAMARKAWLKDGDVLNARGAEDVIAFAKRRPLEGGERSSLVKSKTQQLYHRGHRGLPMVCFLCVPLRPLW